MHVALAADRQRIAELLGYVRQRRVQLTASRAGARADGALGPELGKREDGRDPSAKCLGCKALARVLLHVAIDVARVDPVSCAMGVDVLKQPLSGNVATATHDPRQRP